MLEQTVTDTNFKEVVNTQLQELKLAEIWEHKTRHSNCCIFCKQKFSKKKVRKTKDHLIAKTHLKEASHRFRQIMYQNLVVNACFACNQEKGSRSVSEFYHRAASGAWMRNRILVIMHTKRILV